MLFAAPAEDLQVSLPGVLSVLSAIFTLALGGYSVLLRWVIHGYEKRIHELEQRVTRADDRLHLDELATTKLVGDLNLLKHTHEVTNSDIDEIKAKMVTRAEWEPRMTALEKMIERVLVEVQRSQGRYSSSSALGAVGPVPAAPPPPRRSRPDPGERGGSDR